MFDCVAQMLEYEIEHMVPIITEHFTEHFMTSFYGLEDYRPTKTAVDLLNTNTCGWFS